MLMPDSTQYTRTPQNLLAELVAAKRRNGESDIAACARLAPRLSALAHPRPFRNWSPRYIVSVLHGTMMPSRRVIRAIRDLYVGRRPRISVPKPRVYTPVASEDERELINRLPAARRRELLLAAAKENHV